MENKQKISEELTIYNLDDLPEQTDYPARAVCELIKPALRSIIEDRRRLNDVYLGIGEIVKDVEVHGDDSDPRLVIVRRELGGVAIDTVNTIKEHTEHNGLGKIILERVFGKSYSSTIEDGVYRGHLYINRDITLQTE
ncbi:MAG: hypothetical protein WCK26_00035 [Candidatus Saccharibacteria bacterium]